MKAGHPPPAVFAMDVTLNSAGVKSISRSETMVAPTIVTSDQPTSAPRQRAGTFQPVRALAGRMAAEQQRHPHGAVLRIVVSDLEIDQRGKDVRQSEDNADEAAIERRERRDGHTNDEGYRGQVGPGAAKQPDFHCERGDGPGEDAELDCAFRREPFSDGEGYIRQAL